MSSNIVPLDAKAPADAETEIKRQLFDWADATLAKIGLAKKIAQAKTVEALKRIKLDVAGIDITLAINAALHPSGGAKRAQHFEHLKGDALRRIIKMRFDEMVRYRELELERARTSSEAAYDPAVSLPDVIAAVIGEYVDIAAHEMVAATLWTLLTHIFQKFMITPRLALRSPTPGCGKTTFLDVLSLLCKDGQRFDHISAASLFRAIARDHLTALIDEADALDIVGTIRSVMNSGYRKGGVVTRVIEGELRRFSTFGPMAIGVIGSLPEMLLQRSIIIDMQRSLRTDLQRFDFDDRHVEEVVRPLQRQMRAWARSKPALNLNPAMPAKLRNRVSDNWLVLISIADCFGAAWGEKARTAAETFLRFGKDADLTVMLLTDIRRVFDGVLHVDRCRNEELVAALHALHDAAWNEFCGVRGTGTPHKIREPEVSKLLRERYGVRPGTVWPAGPRSSKSKSYAGYMRAWFEDAWARYCQADE